MKKELSKLGLVGILSLGLLGSSAYGLETNEKGFPVPGKNNTELAGEKSNVFTNEKGDLLIIDRLLYRKADGSGFTEVLVNGKTAIYRIFPTSIDNTNDYFDIEDNNCDGVFETKYNKSDPEANERDLPLCYYKK